MVEYNYVKPVKFFCQKILPLVYDDSLSYYECLCKMKDTLNLVIEDINGLPEYIAELLDESELGQILDTLLNEMRTQIAAANEGESETATGNRMVGDLVWLDGKLYRVTNKMVAGDRYVVNSNVEKVTIEKVIEDVAKGITNIIEEDSRLAGADRSTGDIVWLNNKLYLVTADIPAGSAYTDSNSKLVTINDVINDFTDSITDALNAVIEQVEELISSLNQSQVFKTVAEMIEKEYEVGDKIETFGYYGNDNGGAKYIVRNIEETDVISETVDGSTSYTGLVRLLNDKCAEIVGNKSVYNIEQYGAKGDGEFDNYDIINDLIQYHVVTNGEEGVVIYLPKGKFRITMYLDALRTGNVPTLLRDLHGLIIRGEGDESIIYGYSESDTFDVLQLNCVENLRIENLRILARKADVNPYGANGISMTNGTSNIWIDHVTVEDLPYYLPGGYIDGGKPFTIQTSTGLLHPIENIFITNCRTKGCPYGMEASYHNTQTPLKNVIIENNVFDSICFGITLSSGYYGVPVAGSNCVVCKNDITAPSPIGIGRVNNCRIIDNVAKKIPHDSTFNSYVTSAIVNLLKCTCLQLIRNTFVSDESVHAVVMFQSAYDGDNYYLMVMNNWFEGTADYGFRTKTIVDDTEGNSIVYKSNIMYNMFYTVSTAYDSQLNNATYECEVVEYGH